MVQSGQDVCQAAIHGEGDGEVRVSGLVPQEGNAALEGGAALVHPKDSQEGLQEWSSWFPEDSSGMNEYEFEQLRKPNKREAAAAGVAEARTPSPGPATPRAALALQPAEGSTSPCPESLSTTLVVRCSGHCCRPPADTAATPAGESPMIWRPTEETHGGYAASDTGSDGSAVTYGPVYFSPPPVQHRHHGYASGVVGYHPHGPYHHSPGYNPYGAYHHIPGYHPYGAHHPTVPYHPYGAYHPMGPYHPYGAHHPMAGYDRRHARQPSYPVYSCGGCFNASHIDVGTPYADMADSSGESEVEGPLRADFQLQSAQQDLESRNAQLATDLRNTEVELASARMQALQIAQEKEAVIQTLKDQLEAERALLMAERREHLGELVRVCTDGAHACTPEPQSDVLVTTLWHGGFWDE